MADNVSVASGSYTATVRTLDLDSAHHQVVAAVRASFDHGRKSAVGATALQLTTTSTPTLSGVWVKADPDNTGDLYVGNSDVTAESADATDGYLLNPGASVLVQVDNANKVYVIGSAAGQAAFWLVA